MSMASIEARPALTELARRGVTPIFASSKTAVEILAFSAPVAHCAIYLRERAAVCFLGQILTAFSLRAHWLDAVHQLRENGCH